MSKRTILNHRSKFDVNRTQVCICLFLNHIQTPNSKLVYIFGWLHQIISSVNILCKRLLHYIDLMGINIFYQCLTIQPHYYKQKHKLYLVNNKKFLKDMVDKVRPTFCMLQVHNYNLHCKIINEDRHRILLSKLMVQQKRIRRLKSTLKEKLLIISCLKIKFYNNNRRIYRLWK